MQGQKNIVAGYLLPRLPIGAFAAKGPTGGAGL
jgi:hypothetical protein